MTFDYNSTRWRKLAAAIMRRDGYLCQSAKRYGKRTPAEVVHHIFPAELFPEYAWAAWNLTALSRAEHNKMHDRESHALTAEGQALMKRTALRRGIPPTQGGLS